MPDQLVTRWFDQMRSLLDDLPLRGRGQRNPQLFFQLLQPMERRPTAVLELSDHGRRRLIILILAYAYECDRDYWLWFATYRAICRSGPRALRGLAQRHTSSLIPVGNSGPANCVSGI